MPNAYASGAVMLKVGILDQVQLLHAIRYAKFRRVIKETDYFKAKISTKGRSRTCDVRKNLFQFDSSVMQKREVSDVALTTSL